MSLFAYRVAAQRKSTLAPVLLTVAGLVILGCSAGVKPTPTGTAGTGGGFGPGIGGTPGHRERRQRATHRRLRRHRHQSGCRRAASRRNTRSSRRSRPSIWWSIARAACSTASTSTQNVVPEQGRHVVGAAQGRASSRCSRSSRRTFASGSRPSTGPIRRTTGRDVPAHQRHARRQRARRRSTTRPPSRPSTMASPGRSRANRRRAERSSSRRRAYCDQAATRR